MVTVFPNGTAVLSVKRSSDLALLLNIASNFHHMIPLLLKVLQTDLRIFNGLYLVQGNVAQKTSIFYISISQDLYGETEQSTKETTVQTRQAVPDLNNGK